MSSDDAPSPEPPQEEEEEEEERRSSPPAEAAPPSAPPSRAAVDPGTRKSPRFPRACNTRPLFKPTRPPPPPTQKQPPPERRKSARLEKEESPERVRVITPLVQPPESPALLPRWELRSMWELASVLNFLHVFRPFLNIGVEFSAEELETALITPNGTLDDVHMPLLKSIPPVIRMALTRDTWITVLCRKLRDWWHWVADGEIPIVASHGMEVETYKTLEPGTRVRILKALCDIRVEQEDIRNFIDNSIKRRIQLPAFRKERVGGDAHGISYWYEDDPIIGHRLYREIRQVEVKKKAKRSSATPIVSYQWETVATNLDEFQDVSEKLFSSSNKTEVSLGKKLKIDFLPEIEKIHRSKEKLLKKQHREALLLDSYLLADGLSSGRSLRDRKPVTYTFDDYDRSINEAIKVTKKRQSSPENVVRRARSDLPINGKWNGFLQSDVALDGQPSNSNDHEETNQENQAELLQRSNRRRKRPQRYSENDYVGTPLVIDTGYDSDDDIVGEAIYDEEYLRIRKQRKMMSSGSDGDEEYRWENTEEEEEEYSLSTSNDIEENHRDRKFPSRRKRETKLRYVDELQRGLRRSKRSTRPRISYKQYALSDTDADSGNIGKPSAINAHLDSSEDLHLSTASRDSQDIPVDEDIPESKTMHEYGEDIGKEQKNTIEKSEDQTHTDVEKRRFLDLNELAPGTGFDDGLSTRDENRTSST